MSSGMVEVRHFQDALTEEDVWACLGSRDRALPALAEEVSNGIELYREIGDPRAMYVRVPIEAVERRRVAIRGGLSLDGAFLAHCFEGAEEAAFIVVTIGDELERRVADHFASGDSLEGIVLDAVGSAGIMDVFSQVANQVFDDVTSDGFQTGMCLRPGQSYWDITGQRTVFQLVDADSIGVELMESCFMVPQKSQSAVVPIGRDLKVHSDPMESYCRYCNAVRCPMRQEPQDVQGALA